MKRRDADDLWQRFGAGDGSAFAQLYRDHHHDVVRYCHSLLHDAEDARDAAQCAWAAIWASSSAAQRQAPLRPWLFRVAHNESMSILRRRRSNDVPVDLELPALDDVAADFELRERLTTLRDDLLSLPERQRSALLLREVVGLTHGEIAEVFGTSAHAAKQTIYEARRGLIEAEGGRSLACRDVQRAISDGDGRVRRGRRLRAHLRGCASCRAFAEAVDRQRGDLHVLFPPAVALAALAPAVAGSAVGAGAGGAASGGGAAGGGLMAAGGSVMAKVAVTAAVVTAGVGGGHVIARRHGDAREAAPPRAAGASRHAASVVGSSPATGGVVHRSALVVVSARRTAVAPARRASTPPPAPARTTGAPAVPPGQAKKAGAVVVPPGQAKKAEDTAAAVATTPAVPSGHGKAGVPPGHAAK